MESQIISRKELPFHMFQHKELWYKTDDNMELLAEFGGAWWIFCFLYVWLPLIGVLLHAWAYGFCFDKAIKQQQ